MSLLRRVFSERRAVVVPVTIFLVGNIAVLALVVWPLQRSVAGGEESKWRANAGRSRPPALRKSRPRRIARARIGGHRAAEVLHGDSSKDDRTAIGATTFSLSRLAEASHVTFKVGQWDRSDVKDSTLVRLEGTGHARRRVLQRP
jgi:hypothetical protein